MNHLWIAPVAAGAAMVPLYALAPGVFLRLGLLLYPRDHDRCREFIAELHQIRYRERSLWVTGVILRCVFEGTSERVAFIRTTRTMFTSGALIDLPNGRFLWISMEDIATIDKFDPVLWRKLLGPCRKSVAELSAKDRRALKRAIFYHRNMSGVLLVSGVISHS